MQRFDRLPLQDVDYSPAQAFSSAHDLLVQQLDSDPRDAFSSPIDATSTIQAPPILTALSTWYDTRRVDLMKCLVERSGDLARLTPATVGSLVDNDSVELIEQLDWDSLGCTCPEWRWGWGIPSVRMKGSNSGVEK